MKNIKTVCIPILLLVGSLVSQAQVIPINEAGSPAPKLADGISPALRKQLISGVEQKLMEYAEAAKLTDKSSNRVTTESAERFRRMFTSDYSNVPKDFLEFPPEELVSVRDYSDEVYRRLKLSGVQIQLNKAQLLSIEDARDFYEIKVRVEKRIFNQLTERGGEQKVAEGKKHIQEIQFDVLKEDISRITIYRIKGEGKPAAALYVRYFGPSLGVFTTFGTPSFSSFWTENHTAGSSLRVGGSLSFGSGFEFLTNRLSSAGAPKKNIFLTAGVQLNLLRVRTRLDNFSISAFQGSAVSGSNTLIYRRTVSELNVKEYLNVGTLTIPIGFAYRMKESRSSEVFLSFKFLPSYALFRLGNLSGTGIYVAELPAAMWNSARPNSVNPLQLDKSDKLGPLFIGERIIDEVNTPEINVFLLSAQFSPQVYFHLSDGYPGRWALLLALDFTYHFSSPVQHEGISEDILRYPNDYNSGILQRYTTNMSLFSAGFRIGLQHRLVSKP